MFAVGSLNRRGCVYSERVVMSSIVIDTVESQCPIGQLELVVVGFLFDN